MDKRFLNSFLVLVLALTGCFSEFLFAPKHGKGGHAGCGLSRSGQAGRRVQGQGLPASPGCSSERKVGRCASKKCGRGGGRGGRYSRLDGAARQVDPSVSSSAVPVAPDGSSELAGDGA